MDVGRLFGVAWPEVAVVQFSLSYKFEDMILILTSQAIARSPAAVETEIESPPPLKHPISLS